MKNAAGAAFRRLLLALPCWLGLTLQAAEPTGEPAGPDFAPRFYRSGEANRPVAARIEGTPGAIDAALLGCAGCHGRAGEGRREGGTQAADIRFGQLAGAGYGPTSFCRAVREGEGPGGRKLARAMPRYDLSEGECQALWDHLRRLEQELPPGVDAREIRIGVEMRRETPARLAWREALHHELETANERGGVYGRRLRLAAGGETAALRVLVDGEPPALVSPGELLISVPPPRDGAGGHELWQVETPHEEQLRLIAADAPAWLEIAGQGDAARQAETLFSDAAADAGVEIESGAGCAAGRRPVLALMADQETLPRLAALDACAERILLFAPALPLAAFDGLESPLFLVVPFDPGPAHDLHAGAHALGRAIVAALVAAGRGLRQPRLAEELSRAFLAWGGSEKALFGGVLLLPRGENAEPPRWLGPRRKD